ncbi:hypothetical protein F5Y15DRAFT_10918 [Xylariaceae sp. FL0016]|nr:hypothetical protein F5Y15DRAFT_10918 [Xylariaceae sp. FL0016]
MSASNSIANLWRGSLSRDRLNSRDLMLDRIQEGTEYTSSRSGPQSRETRSIAWPFHNRNTSEVASTLRSSRVGGWFRQQKPFFRPHDDTASIDQSIVPDYVINYMRGETPETLARKKERQNWGKQNVDLTPRPGSYASHLVEFGHYYSSSTDLTRGMNGQGSRSGRSSIRRHITGWRGGVIFNTFLAIIILVVGIIAFIVVVTKTKKLSGSAAIFTGNCTKANHVEIGVHVVINVLSMALLAGANYSFQVLTSPTRPELAAAHEKERWLDIGIPSIRNFAYISGFRVAVAITLLLAAIATQVIYNAIIFTSQDVQQNCSVEISTSILGIAVLLNLVVVLSMAIVVAHSSFKPIATLGDAIRSFLESPDPTTHGKSLMTKTDVRQGRWNNTEARAFQPSNHYWLHTPSFSRWGLVIFSWVALGCPTAVALGMMLSASADGSLTPFGRGTSATTFAYSSTIQMPQLSLLAALPQFLLAVLYLVINAHLTTYFLSHELSLFALGPRSLRVSAVPFGTQHTSLFLTLPRPVSWALLLTFAGLGLVLNQSVFAVAQASPSSPATQTLSISLSTTALLALLAVLVALLLVVLGMGLRLSPAASLVDGKAKGNPLALPGGSCSAVISSRSHPNRGPGEIEMWLGPVGWGVLREGGGTLPGTCGFSSGGRMGPVDVGRTYA